MAKFINAAKPDAAKVSKGVAVHTVVVIIMFAFFLFITAIVAYQWMNPVKVQADKISCTFKLIAYCADWKANSANFDTSKRPSWTWSSKNPQGCDAEEIKIGPPGGTEPAASDCSLYSS